MMRRREFLQRALAAGALPALGGLHPLAASAAGFPSADARVLVKLMLLGGPDMRHVFPPAFDPAPGSYGYRYWQVRAGSHGIGSSPADWERRWQEDYFQTGDGTTAFGIHRNCGWLKREWDAGRVAIVCNAYGGTSRDHAHCIDIVDQGNRAFAPNQAYGAGWGGKLADATGGNVLALTPAPRPFCYGPATDGRAYSVDRMVSASNVRELNLHKPAPDVPPLDGEAVIARSLSSYYAALRDTVPSGSTWERFVNLERQLRELGEPIDARLADIPVPPAMAALYEGQLSNPSFGLQVRNLHDAFACRDILSLRVASIDYGGWDSHQGQVAMIEPALNDIFGDGQGLDVLYGELPGDTLDNMVLVVAGEFGRQLRANGDNGTDHGEGNAMLLIGRGVRGGVYGEMFPEAELSRLQDPSPQIEGLTGFEHVFGAACDWVQGGAGASVFPDRATSPLEPGVDPGTFFL